MSLPRDHARYDSLFRHYNQANGNDWRLMKAQAICESALNPRAVSRVGAEGLTQFMPGTWKEVMGTNADPFNPEAAIQAQSVFMARLLDKFEGNIEQSLAAYNCGPARVANLLRTYGEGWKAHLPAETQQYLQRIAATRAQLDTERA